MSEISDDAVRELAWSLRHKPIPPMELWAARFDESYIPEPTTGCFLWTGTVDPDGYGHLALGDKMYRAHRLAWVRAGRTLDPNLVLDHKCLVKCCVNADHLRQISSVANTMLGTSPQAKNARKTHCPYGHEYHYSEVSKRRHCVPCEKVAREKYLSKQGVSLV